MIEVMSDLTAGGGNAAGTAVVDVARVARRARELLDEGRMRAAREIAREALDAAGRPAVLLWLLADAEFAGGDALAGRDYLAEAVAASQDDPASVALQMRALRRNGFWREALSLAETVPADVQRNPLVRTETGAFYRACGCPAHAAERYGPRCGLERQASTARRWCRVRSGGPVLPLRRKAYAWEETVLESLRRPSGYIADVAAVEGLDAQYAHRVQVRLETMGYQVRRLWDGFFAVNRAGYRLIPLAVVPVWLILLAVVSLAGFAHGFAGVAGFSAVSTLFATAPVVAITRTLMKPDGTYRPVARIPTRAVLIGLFAIAVLEAMAGEGYARHLLPGAGWRAAAILGLIVIPASVAWLLAAALVQEALLKHQGRKIGEDSLLNALDSMLLVLHDLRTSRVFRGMDQRLDHCRHLEFAARCLERDLLPPHAVSFLGSRSWLTHRAAGWAEAIRHMQRQLVAPIPGRQDKLERLLAHEIRCLATGDLGALAWHQPPPSPSRRTTARRQAIALARAVTAAVLPFAAVLAAQPFLHTSPGVFGWARVTTGIWALLYVLLSIDPTIRDKISTARDLAELLHTPPASHDDQTQKRTGP